MQARIGGTVLTVPDFIHASVGHVPECAQHMVTYFETGRPDNGTCPGVQPDPELASGSGSGSVAVSSLARQVVQPLVYDPTKRNSFSKNLK